MPGEGDIVNAEGADRDAAIDEADEGHGDGSVWTEAVLVRAGNCPNSPRAVGLVGARSSRSTSANTAGPSVSVGLAIACTSPAKRLSSLMEDGGSSPR